MNRHHHDRPTGFTLVELLVAMAITAILSIAIFALFDTTSQALYEADSLAQSVDSVRFTVEQLRSDLKQASAYATPDSSWDPQVRPEPGETVSLCDGSYQEDIGNYRIAGLVSYSNWQDYAQNVMPGPIWNANQDGNLHPDFDGIVLIGAYDYPFMFEAGELSPGSVQVFDHPRGLDKLGTRNIFDLAKPRTGFDPGSSQPLDVVNQREMTNRILRLRDPSGFYQFIGIESLSEVNNQHLQLSLTSFSGADSLFFKPSCAQDVEYGFPSRTQQDSGERYYASLLDVYWYHVRQDPANPNNFLLVRERLDGWDVMQALSESWGNFDPSAHTRGQYTVIAERVVDFQLWFDCTENNDGTIQNMDWETGWNPPGGTSTSSSNPHHGCLDPNAGSGSDDQPETPKVRVGHVRLSVRTEHERSDLTHNPFPAGGPSGNTRRLETFDVHPNQPGATRVYTAQADFEVPNYAIRNLTP